MSTYNKQSRSIAFALHHLFVQIRHYILYNSFAFYWNIANSCCCFLFCWSYENHAVVINELNKIDWVTVNVFPLFRFFGISVRIFKILLYLWNGTYIFSAWFKLYWIPITNNISLLVVIVSHFRMKFNWISLSAFI